MDAIGRIDSIMFFSSLCIISLTLSHDIIQNLQVLILLVPSICPRTDFFDMLLCLEMGHPKKVIGGVLLLYY